MGEGAFDPFTYVINDKARFAAGGTRKLNFIGEKSRFEEITTWQFLFSDYVMWKGDIVRWV